MEARRNKCVFDALFGGFCFRETRHARHFLYLSALAEQVYALKTLENAAFFRRCGSSAFEAVVLRHKILLFKSIKTNY